MSEHVTVLLTRFFHANSVRQDEVKTLSRWNRDVEMCGDVKNKIQQLGI